LSSNQGGRSINNWQKQLIFYLDLQSSYHARGVNCDKGKSFFFLLLLKA